MAEYQYINVCKQCKQPFLSINNGRWYCSLACRNLRFPGFKHGTRARYTHKSCRCKACCEANRAYLAEYHRSRREADPNYNRNHARTEKRKANREAKP